jgi:hypothetical protein
MPSSGGGTVPKEYDEAAHEHQHQGGVMDPVRQRLRADAKEDGDGTAVLEAVHDPSPADQGRDNRRIDQPDERVGHLGFLLWSKTCPKDERRNGGPTSHRFF